ncbi:MAG: DciA family protein [Brachymonas sp.]|nr:DciA family protein [Brachymonas sp.]
MQRRHHQPFTLEEAAHEAPVLGRLMQQAEASRACADCIAPLVPPALRAQISYGGIDENGQWCVLVPHHAAAAKLRQLLPRWLERLQQQGFAVQGIRLKQQVMDSAAR